jgi:hypothetical protein
MATTSAVSLTGITSAVAGIDTSTQSIFSVSKNDLLSLLKSTQVSSDTSTGSTSLQSLLSSFDQAASASGTMSLSQFRSFAANNGISLAGSSSQGTNQAGSTYASYAGGASGTTTSSATKGGNAASGSSAATGSTASTSASSAAGGTSSAESASATEDLASISYSELEVRAAAGDQAAIKELERRSALYGGNVIGQSQGSGALFSAYA